MTLDITRQTPESVSHAIVSGTAYDGADAIPVIAQAPGYLPSPWGKDEAVSERLVLEDQDYANMIAGRVIANANREIVDVSVPLAGNWLPALDIAPQNWVQMNVQAADTKRGISLEGYYHLRNITSEIKVKGGTSLADVTLVPEAFGPDGVPGPYPDDWPWPTFPLPDFPEFPPWAFPRWDTLMVRNCWGDFAEPYIPYQATVINDPSSIMGNLHLGDEETNLLAYTEYDNSIDFVTDGIFIFFHQFEGDWGNPNGYDYRIYRHDIATGAADYLLFPDDSGDAYFAHLTCIDIGIVAAIIDTEIGGVPTCKMYEVNFNTGVVTEKWSHSHVEYSWPSYAYTVQSTVNVYTVMQLQHYEIYGPPFYLVAYVEHHRYNWTTGVADSILTWEFTDGVIVSVGGASASPPVIAGDTIYSWIEIGISEPKGKGWILWYNFITGGSGSILVFLSGVSSVRFYHTGYYKDLGRIYFVVRTSPEIYYEYYISTLTKEVTPVRTLGPPDHENEIWKMVGNKHKCRNYNYYDSPAVVFYDPYTGEERPVGSDSVDEGDFHHPQPHKWSAQLDDITDHIWSFQGHYIIGQSELYDNIIAETGITPPTGVDWDYIEVGLYVLGRTFIVHFIDWNTFYKMAYVVHYPGSLVE